MMFVRRPKYSVRKREDVERRIEAAERQAKAALARRRAVAGAHVAAGLGQGGERFVLEAGVGGLLHRAHDDGGPSPVRSPNVAMIFAVPSATGMHGRAFDAGDLRIGRGVLGVAGEIEESIGCVLAGRHELQAAAVAAQLELRGLEQQGLGDGQGSLGLFGRRPPIFFDGFGRLGFSRAGDDSQDRRGREFRREPGQATNLPPGDGAVCRMSYPVAFSFIAVSFVRICAFLASEIVSLASPLFVGYRAIRRRSRQAGPWTKTFRCRLSLEPDLHVLDRPGGASAVADKTISCSVSPAASLAGDAVIPLGRGEQASVISPVKGGIALAETLSRSCPLRGSFAGGGGDREVKRLFQFQQRRREPAATCV